MIMLISAVGFMVWWLIRSVRLRIVLSGNHPRALLLGDLHRKALLIRLAFLAGLPSSLWNFESLGTTAFWGFLLSRPMVYVGFLVLKQGYGWFGTGVATAVGLLVLVSGHLVFFAAKRLAARSIWNPGDGSGARPTTLFLRSFQDDQFDFRQSRWNWIGRWFDLWSFRRNADEVLIDAAAQYGPVVALGRPGEKRIPFGAMRYYSTDEDWQTIVAATARRAQAIVICAGDSPGVLWEYELLSREHLLDRTLLLFRPTKGDDATNLRALDAFSRATTIDIAKLGPGKGSLIALTSVTGEATLLRAARPTAAAYVVALRAFFHKCDPCQLSDNALSL